MKVFLKVTKVENLRQLEGRLQSIKIGMNKGIFPLYNRAKHRARMFWQPVMVIGCYNKFHCHLD
ncbi:MAG: hypothetical protein IPJ43_10590 [Saprospiraceae bacterium]|nr:hypothetical protein [Saprospiraceae bacterium]